MTHEVAENPPEPAVPTPVSAPKPPVRRRWSRVWAVGQFILALVIVGAVLMYLWSPFKSRGQSASVVEPSNDDAAVQLVGHRLVRVKLDAPMGKNLVITTVESKKMSAPVLKVTGSIVARLPPGKGTAEGRWDFNSPDLATAYADWIRARAEVPFAEKQLVTIRKLTVAKVAAQTKVVERLEKLVKAGTDPQKDLDTARADLLQVTLQGQKDEHEAETALKNASRTQATLERQLFQAGIDPELLARTLTSIAIVVAEVPEAWVDHVYEKQGCVARFYSFPDVTFPGRVGSLASTLARDRRTLRVFFEVNDPQGRLKPAMFAKIDLGTDLREVLLVPADAVVHVGQSDYVFVEAEADTWRITEVKVGEAIGPDVEVVSGLKSGARVIGKGAILLKPFVVQEVQVAPKRGPDPSEKKGGV